jgi:hypothetical protein
MIRFYLDNTRISEDNLVSAIQPYLEIPTEERGSQISEELRSKNDLIALEQYLEDLIESEPALSASLEVRDEEEQTSTLILNEDVSTAIIQTAGNVITQTFGDHFRITETGIQINPQNPPDLEQSYKAVQMALSMKDSAAKLDNYSTWMLGNLIDELENLHGEDFNIGQIVDQSNKSYNTIITSLGVFRAFKTRRYQLSFSAHKEVHYSKITDDDKHFVLAIGEKLHLGTKTLRALCSLIRHNGRVELTDAVIENQDTLEELLKVKKTRSHTFVFKMRDRWYRYRGPKSQVPNQATDIIDIDDRELIVDEEVSAEIPLWIQ